MNNADAAVGATEVLDHMHSSHHHAPTQFSDGDRSGTLPRLLAAWVVFAATVLGISSPASSFSMTMEPSIVSVVCNGSYGSIGRLSGAAANEVILLVASPDIQLLPARSSSSGNYTMIWKCDPAQAGTQWNVVATGMTSGRSTSFTVIADAAPLPPLPAVGTNILANADIESGSTSPWVIIDQSGTTTMSATATSIAQSGTRTLLAASGANAGGSIGQDISAAIEPGQTFTYSIWARHPHTGGTPQSASIVLETIGGAIESSVLAVTVSDVWQRFDVTLSVGSTGHTGLRVKLAMLTPTSTDRGSYLLDSASLIQSSPNPFGLLELATGASGSVSVKGYAIDPNQPHDAVPIVISIGGVQTLIAADIVRTDVASMYPSAGPVHGFDAQIATGLSGITQVCAVAKNLGVGADTALGCVTTSIGAVTTTTVPTTAVPTTAAPTTAAPTTTVAPTTVPTTAAPTTTTPPTTATPTTASPTTVTPTTAPPTTATPTTAPPTTATPSTTTTVPEPLGPQTLEPNRLLSLFSAGDLVSMTTAYDFQIGDADTLRLYWAFFNREPDIAGAKYWIGLSRAGMTLDEMAFNFARSVEFGLTYGSVSDHEFLGIVYRNVLGRRYDAAGYDYWLSVIENGLPRSGAVRWIAANAEFVAAHPYP